MATVLIGCNVSDCSTVPAQGMPAESITDLRRKLAKVGWRSDPALDLDLCPYHAAKLR